MNAPLREIVNLAMAKAEDREANSLQTLNIINTMRAIVGADPIEIDHESESSSKSSKKKARDFIKRMKK